MADRSELARALRALADDDSDPNRKLVLDLLRSCSLMLAVPDQEEVGIVRLRKGQQLAALSAVDPQGRTMAAAFTDESAILSYVGHDCGFLELPFSEILEMALEAGDDGVVVDPGGPVPLPLPASMLREIRAPAGVGDDLPETAKPQGPSPQARSSAASPPAQQEAVERTTLGTPDAADGGTALPLSLEDARRIAQGHFGGNLVISDRHTVEREWGWAFSATPRRYVQTGATDDFVFGIGPVLINRHDGTVATFDSSRPTVGWVEHYERQLARKRLRQRLRSFLLRLWPSRRR